MDRQAAQVPVTFLTGLVGAGKTALLNHILTNQQGLRSAVLATGDQMVELSNGCICCSINGELLEAVQRVRQRPETIDILVLNKADLVDEQRLAEVEAELRAIQAQAGILRACRGKVPLGLLLSEGLFESDQLAALQAKEESPFDLRRFQ